MALGKKVVRGGILGKLRGAVSGGVFPQRPVLYGGGASAAPVDPAQPDPWSKWQKLAGKGQAPMDEGGALGPVDPTQYGQL